MQTASEAHLIDLGGHRRMIKLNGSRVLVLRPTIDNNSSANKEVVRLSRAKLGNGPRVTEFHKSSHWLLEVRVPENQST